MIVKRFDKISIFAATFLVIEFVIFSIIILFVFELVVIIIVIIIIIIFSVVIVIRIIIILTTLIKELIAFRFNMIMFFTMNAIFDEFLNDFAIEIKHNAFLKLNNNNMF